MEPIFIEEHSEQKFLKSNFFKFVRLEISIELRLFPPIINLSIKLLLDKSIDSISLSLRITTVRSVLLERSILFKLFE